LEQQPPDSVIADMSAAVVAHVSFPDDMRRREPEARLAEAIGLVEAIDLRVADTQIIHIGAPKPSTLIGSGKVEALKSVLDSKSPRPGIVIIDASLSPVQHRNLEKALAAKVLDRTGLILEIFGARARTAEGRLQVDLAHLTYQKSRLVRSWTHLERQRGGRGFLGGPGERQIESDRRAIDDKIDRLKAKLEDVRRTRALQRAKRQRAPHPVVALVGYTNAGKSTLFNLLTKSGVIARDQLFATLDPTMRAVDLPSGQRIILSDTVGFVSDLPTQLIAAFRATLEEAIEADVIIHVRDAAHRDTEAQRDDVLTVLSELGAVDGGSTPFIEVLNKIDLLSAEARRHCEASEHDERDTEFHFAEPGRVCLSAITGEGAEKLLALVDRIITKDWLEAAFLLDSADGKARAWLHEHADVVSEAMAEDQLRLVVRLTEKTLGQAKRYWPRAKIEQTQLQQAAPTRAVI
jgi:GTP-binding protein HflX